MTDDYAYRPELREKARSAFEIVRGRVLDGDAAGDAATRWHAVHYAELRSAELRAKMRDHFAEHAPRWIRREIEKLRRENPRMAQHSLAHGPRSPFFAASIEASRELALAARARANVKARCEERLQNVEAIERRLVRGLTHERRRSR
jgi:hypothetical protein